MTKTSSRRKALKWTGIITGGWLAATVAYVGTKEGLRNWTYRDIVGVPTYCFGETRNAVMGRYTPTEKCEALLASRLIEFNEGVNRCVKVDITDNQRTAFVSLSYNIGIGAFCRSTLVREVNKRPRDPRVCDYILRFNKGRIRGKLKVIRGLDIRRKEERDICVKGL